MLNALQQFLLDNPVDNVVEEIVVSTRLQNFKFKVKAMTGGEYNSYQTLCVDNPNSPKKRKFNVKKFNELIVINHTIEPNFKDADFLKESKCEDSIRALYKYLLPGEINALAEKILDVSGFNNDIEEDMEEVKNS